jgi:hypothetical protein
VKHLKPEKKIDLYKDNKNTGPVNKCSSVNAKGKPCGAARQVLVNIRGKSYCKDHLPKEDDCGVISDDDSDGEDYFDYDENNNNNIKRKLTLGPVIDMPKVEHLFEKIECSVDKCSVSMIQPVRNQTAWICPIHVVRVKILVKANEPSPLPSLKEERAASVSTETASASTSSVVIEEKKKPVAEKPKETRQKSRKFKLIK